MTQAIAHAGDVKTARQASQRTLAAAETVGDCNYVIDELVGLAQGLALTRDREGLAEMLASVNRIERGDFSRGDILVGIARAMAQIGDGLGLLDMITSAQDVGYTPASSETLARIVQLMAEIGDIDGLRHVAAAAQHIEHPSCSGVMSAVALALAQLGEIEEAGNILSSSPLNYIFSPELRWEYASALGFTLSNIAQVLALAGQFSHALEIAACIEPSGPRVRLSKDIDPTREETYIAIALGIVRQMQSLPNSQEGLLLTLAAIERIEDANICMDALIAIAESLVAVNEPVWAQQVLALGLERAPEIEDRKDRTRALVKMAEVWLKADEVPRAQEILALALDVAKGIEDRRHYVQMLLEIAEALIQANEVGQARKVIQLAVEITEQIADALAYAWATTDLAEFLVHIHQVDWARSILSLALRATERVEDAAYRVP